MSAVDRRLVTVIIVVLSLLIAGVAVEAFTGQEPTDRTQVTFVDSTGTELGTVDVRVADTFQERYIGLSETDALGENEGMLFVHDTEATRTFVMRNMSFPIDIVFVGADGRITTIHHAEVEERPLTEYQGRAQWVIEIPYEWTDRHGVSVGDRVRIEFESS